MRNFTVKEISEILNTNPETVRRWIRDGRLEAEQVSRKDGNVVSERSLNEFLKKTPKYATVAASSLATGLTASGFGALAGLSIMATTAIVSKFISDKKPSGEVSITPEKMEKYLSTSIQECEDSIIERRKKIEALEKEILEQEQQVEDLRKSLVRIKSVSEL